MPFCPSCRSEYREGFDRCADCAVVLVGQLDSAGADEAESTGDLVTVGAFETPVEASLFASRLEAEGIESWINDAETIGMNALLTNAVGGVKVQVRASDAAKVAEIRIEKPVEGSDAAARCPHCGSTGIFPERVSLRLAFLSMLLLGFPFLFRSRNWKCAACRKVFPEGAAGAPPPSA